MTFPGAVLYCRWQWRQSGASKSEVCPVRLRNYFLLTVLIPCVLIGTEAACRAAKPIMVHYMPWFASPPYSGDWKWHWTMNAFNPAVTNANGTQQIA